MLGADDGLTALGDRRSANLAQPPTRRLVGRQGEVAQLQALLLTLQMMAAPYWSCWATLA